MTISNYINVSFIQCKICDHKSPNKFPDDDDVPFIIPYKAPHLVYASYTHESNLIRDVTANTCIILSFCYHRG